MRAMIVLTAAYVIRDDVAQNDERLLTVDEKEGRNRSWWLIRYENAVNNRRQINSGSGTMKVIPRDTLDYRTPNVAL